MASERRYSSRRATKESLFAHRSASRSFSSQLGSRPPRIGVDCCAALTISQAQIIGQSTKDYRREFEVRHRFDASIDEAAEEAGISIGATKSRLLRARNAVRDSFSSGGGRAQLRHRSLG
jgi:hypothetical protein